MMYIDHPVDSVISGDHDYIEGWCHADNSVGLTANINGTPVTVVQVSRPDLPTEGVVGFRAYFSVFDIVDKNPAGVNEAIFELFSNRISAGKINFTISSSVADSYESVYKDKIWKRNWIINHIICPICGSKSVRDGAEEAIRAGGNIECGRCKTSFPQNLKSAINIIRSETGISPGLSSKEDGISAHYYSDEARDILRPVSEDGGVILDVGAGFRRSPLKNVIALEIFDYPSTDLCSTGDTIPLETASVDAVYCMAVLEHVPNPFEVAKEILRVLKPHGVLISGVPFLQPEHGYPYHYFNCTRMGHLKLYGDEIEMLKFHVDKSSQPWYVIMWILNMYRSHLPANMREDFSKLTVQSILEKPYNDAIDTSPFIHNLSEEGKWALASGTTIFAKKK